MGTIEYMAPEVLDPKDAKPDIGKQDVWSIGVIAYQMCTFRLPFHKETNEQTALAIIKDPHDPIEQDYSKELKDLVDALLTKAPEDRPSIKQLIQIPIIRNAVILLLREFEGKTFFELIAALCDKDPSFKVDLPKSFE